MAGAGGMVAKSSARERARDFCGAREARRSEPAGSVSRGNRALVRAALVPNAGSENVAPPAAGAAVKARHGSQTSAPGTRAGLRSTGGLSARQGAALANITNIVQGRGSQEQGAVKATKAAPVVPNWSLVSPRGLQRPAVAPPAPPAPLAQVQPQVREPYSDAFQGDSSDVQRVSEYASDIFAHLFDEEVARRALATYMDRQTDINGRMRAILIDWLVEVHMKYRLRLETLFLTVNIIDRYLSVRPVSRRRLQLVGVVAMFIAAKFEEIDPPKAADFAYITDNTYTRQEVLDFECTMLVALGFEIVVPTPTHFLDRLARVAGCTAAQRSLAQYVLELSLLELSMIAHTPSVLVSAALLLSSELTQQPQQQQSPWPAAMAHHSRHSEAELRPCVEELRALLHNAPTSTLQAVRRKYQKDCNHGVANMPCCRP